LVYYNRFRFYADGALAFLGEGQIQTKTAARPQIMTVAVDGGARYFNSNLEQALMVMYDTGYSNCSNATCYTLSWQHG